MKHLTAQIDWKKKIVIVVRNGEEENDIIPIDEAGNIELTETIFQPKHQETAVMAFEHELEEMLSYEQQIALYANWGSALSIMTSNTANVLGIEKIQAKTIIQLAERYGLLYAGHNCTWKAKDGKILRARWSDKAKNMQKSDNSKVKETPQEVLAKFAKMSKSLEEKTKQLPKKKIKEVEQSVDIIHEQEETLEGEEGNVVENVLHSKLKALEHKAKTFTDWSETVTPWSVNNEINAIKKQLKNIEVQKSGKVYKESVNALAPTPLPPSVTRLPGKPTSKPQIIPKKK